LELSPLSFTPFAAMSGFAAEEPCFKIFQNIILWRWGIGGVLALRSSCFIDFVLMLFSRHLFDFFPSICPLLFARCLQQILG
jgi:hypothetical protein